MLWQEPPGLSNVLLMRHSRPTIRCKLSSCVLKNRFKLLSGREREVLTLVVEGHLNKQIAGFMGICEYTVKAHRGQVMRKMQARSLAHLIKMTGKLQVSTVSADPQWQHSDHFAPAMVGAI